MKFHKVSILYIIMLISTSCSVIDGNSYILAGTQVSMFTANATETKIFESDSKQVIELTDNDSWEYHVYIEALYHGTVYLPNQRGTYPSPEIITFKDNDWLIIDEVVGKGSGYFEVDRVWYNISTRSPAEVFRYTKSCKYEHFLLGCGIVFKQEVETISDDKSFKIVGHQEEVISSFYEDVIITNKSSFTYNLLDEEIKEFQTFSSGNFAIHRQYKSKAELILRNIESLTEISTGSDEIKKEWLEEFMDDEIKSLFAKINSLKSNRGTGEGSD